MTTSNALFHYTGAAGWDKIRESGFIDTTSRAADHIDGQVELVRLTDDVPETAGLSDPDRRPCPQKSGSPRQADGWTA
ncbi:hypothetical protein ACWC3X_28155 [Streptomyces populi]